MLEQLLKRLFGDKSASEEPEAVIAATEEYNGFELRAAPIEEKGSWRVAGSVAPLDGGEDAQEFVRADVCGNHEDAVETSLYKARQIVDEQQGNG